MADYICLQPDAKKQQHNFWFLGKWNDKCCAPFGLEVDIRLISPLFLLTATVVRDATIALFEMLKHGK